MKKNQTILLITCILLAIAAYFLVTQKKGTIREELRDFAVDDTASINKIFLADKFGNASTIAKEAPGKWTVNGKHIARNDAIYNLLVTIKTMEVRSPVAKAAYNNILKELASKGIKVEVYQNDKLSKTYYVGGATQDQLGTYMFLENSSVPFIMHIPGFNGYLTPRYITSENDWKVRSVFDSGLEEISAFISEDLEQPQNSFMITRQPNGEFLLATYPGKQPVSGTEQNKIQNYLSGFSFINYEAESRGRQEEHDSIRAGGPFRIMTLTDVKNKTTRVRMYHMPETEQSKQMEGLQSENTLPYDRDRMLAQINDDAGFIKIQYYVFGKLFKTPADFLKMPSMQNQK